MLGKWSGTVGAQTYRYVRPQENGNKYETRWLALSDAAEGGSGTLVVSQAAPLSMSCLSA